MGLINGVRASLGLASYAVDAELTANAQRWAQSMAASGAMSHQSDLSGGISSPWVRLGENVGVGLSVVEVHNALMGSPGHYQNIADPGFGYVGVAVVEAGGTLYVAEEFMQL
ncbi:MAG: CAP domain-containing protein [Acidimicrobiia bacterium]